VAGAAKVPFSTRRTLARCMDLPEDCIEMIEQDVGGGFGVRGEFYPEDFLVPFAARQLGRPVKWIEDRRENLLGSNHSREMDIEIELACEKDGRMVALRATAWVDMGAYLRTSGAIPPRTLAQGLSGPYDIPNVHIDVSMSLTNKAPVGTYRGPGRFEGTFFRERLMDMAARDLGIDPVEFRRRNLVKVSQMPYQIATIRPVEQKEWFDGGDYGAALERCVTEFGWAAKAHLQGERINGRYHGLGLACFVEGGAAGPRENVRLELGADGLVSLFTGSANVGQGMETVCAQIASDALALPMEKIRVFHGSTTLMKAGFGAFHSRCVVVGGSAILDAATHLKAALCAAAAARLGCTADAVVIGDHLVASFNGKTIAPEELVGAAPITAEGTFESHKHTYAYGAAAAHVAVDPKTGHVELLDYLMVEDVGRVINPLTMHGQAIGGIMQGLGGAFLEHLVYDDQGQFLSGSLADYLLPSATDFPNIRAIVTGDHPSPNNPLGAKGGGDGGVVPVGGAVANAVSAALSSFGVGVHSLPMSPAHIWKLVQSSRTEARPA
jgi:carbon-monoxide dehydrogenase large subunit